MKTRLIFLLILPPSLAMRQGLPPVEGRMLDSADAP